VIVLQRKVLRSRILLTDGNPLFFIQLHRWIPSALNKHWHRRLLRPRRSSRRSFSCFGCGSCVLMTIEGSSPS
jgi:hypothetical protein